MGPGHTPLMNRTKRVLLWLMAGFYVVAGFNHLMFNWVRLPFQGLWVAWAWWYTR